MIEMSAEELAGLPEATQTIVRLKEEIERLKGAQNLRLVAALVYLYCLRTREGWEEGPTTEECWNRVTDEVANAVGPSIVDVETAGRWIAKYDEEIRATAPFEFWNIARAEVEQSKALDEMRERIRADDST